MKKTAAVTTLLISLALLAPSVGAQGSRKDDIVFGPSGHPVAGATVTVCQATATGTPCSPLATIYTDATLATASANPFQTDGIGNYHFYAPAGRYLIQISSPQLSGTTTYPDVILPPDVSSSSSPNNISAFGLNLGGNLTVAGNATVAGTFTSSSFSPGSFTPSSLSVSGNASFQGPRPYIDVTAYGAKGDGSTNDTVAIQAAITAFCTAPSLVNGGTIFFPPGTYVVAQPQTPSTSPVFSICSGISFAGGNVGTKNGQQFNEAPVSVIIAGGGASPDAAAVFQCIYPSCQGGVSWRDLSIVGVNQAVYINGASVFHWDNVSLMVRATGGTDNTPLKLCNSVWNWYEGGQIITNSTTAIPAVLMCQEATSGPVGAAGLTYFENMLIGEGSVVYAQRVNNAGSPAGNVVFRNVTREGAATDFFTVTDVGSYSNGNFSGLTLDAVVDSDNSASGSSLVTFDTPNTLSGVTISRSGGASGPAIRMTTGSVSGALVNGCQSVCASEIVDGSGNLIGGSVSQNGNGFDVVTATTDANRLRNDTKNASNPSVYTLPDGPPLRMTPSGAAFATAAVDPIGLLLSEGSSYGFSAKIGQTVTNTVDVSFAKLLPPTSIGGAATTGGSLAAGTYYYFLRSSSTGASTNCTDSSVSIPSAPVTVGGSNNAVTVSWTLPASTGISTPQGYCVYRSTSATNTADDASAIMFFVGRGSTANVLDTGTGSGGNTNAPVPTYQAVHRFTPTSLGVNTTSPLFNLDVNGSAAVNSLNGVQKAERFSGSDAAAKINACLTAASASSSLCDARGLTGSLSGSSHIQIPAGTVLLWGAGQLAINDTTNNDAIELMGDGSSVIGYQESGTGTIPRPDASGYISCVPTGCTAVKNPNAATRNVDWVHITGMNLQATGAGSKVLDLSSVGHADLEANRLIMGTGGGSYGIFGDTSSGGFDSTNTLIKHNEIDPQYQNDRCLHLAGVFNIVEMEQNTCILPAANTGTVCFELAKDSNGNYPNNDEFYGNDCEGSSTSFGQIGYNIINADSVTIGPNNRCENVYSCFQFPTDGSAVGIHILDPYISVSANSVVKPNEPSTSQIAIDNNGPNWLPSMHFGFNDLAGRNLLGNAGFEGWSGSTSLYYWGGVTGTSINQAGSGIYAQQASSSSPADSGTQGGYNVKIGDNATAGLGVNSGCVQVDATMNYTLAFRIAASSTGINFRPGFRFYSDPNCTEADKITSVATNARVLQPSEYAGQSALIGTGGNPNWQSTNASLTYNNGITCNCNVTGGDWQVAAANSWTSTRNFAITFRVPNAYSSSSTVAQSMRVFILENTAANPNTIFVDDVALSQGPVSPNVPLVAGVSDSGNPTVYGNLTVNGSLTIGALPATLTSGSPTASDCASFTGTNVQDSGSPCPAQFTKYSMGIASSGQAPSATNAVDVSVIYLPNIQFSHLTVDVSTTDSSTSDFYGWAVTDASGNVKCSITAVNLTAGGASDQSCTQGTVTLAGGAYIFAFTGNATTAKIAYSGTAPLALSSTVSSSTSSSGAMTFPISIPSAGVSYSSYATPAIILH
jgi:hypothetical protein